MINYFVVVLVFVLFVIAFVSLLDLGLGCGDLQDLQLMTNPNHVTETIDVPDDLSEAPRLRSRWKAPTQPRIVPPDRPRRQRDDFDIDLGSYSAQSRRRRRHQPGLRRRYPPTSRDRGRFRLDFGSLPTTEEEPENGRGEPDEETDAGQTRSRRSVPSCGPSSGDWYVVHTYSGMENRVLQNLENRVSSLNMEDYIYEIVVPTEEVTEIRNGQRKQVRRTVLPGYVLVRMDLTDESWSTVRHTPSVTGFVGHSNSPVPLSLDEVEKMLAPAVVAAATASSDSPDPS